MKWQLTDIHAPAAAVNDATVVKSDGGWWHCHSVCGMGIVNATRHAFEVRNLPQTITTHSLADTHAVASIINPGTSGTVDGTDAPWAQRLRTCLDVCERFTTPCMTFIDAPASSEMASSLLALEECKQRIQALLGTKRLLVLALPCNTTYPVLEERQIVYSASPTATLCTGAEWGLHYTIRGSPSDPSRFADVLSTMLGYLYIPIGPLVSTATFPDGYNLPKEAFEYMTFSSNVVPGSARASRTRGISATTTDGKEWHATVILQSNTLTSESQAMACVRRMLTEQSISAVGGSYFALAALDEELPPVVRRVMADVYRKRATMARGLTVGPLCRAASHHRSWD